MAKSQSTGYDALIIRIRKVVLGAMLLVLGFALIWAVPALETISLYSGLGSSNPFGSFNEFAYLGAFLVVLGVILATIGAGMLVANLKETPAST